MTESNEISVSVVVVTYNRPGNVRICLEHLATQSRLPDELLVVDASPNDATAKVVHDFPAVGYLRNELGMGYMATSRAIGVAETSGAVIAFIDDDAYAEPDWLKALLEPYADEGVGAVGGRADNGRPEELAEGTDRVGLLLRDGTLTGHFAADTGGPVDVDHLLGANMSYRRSALDDIGGIHDHWPGTSLREDADTGLRMREAGYRVVYQPTAAVFHVGGTYAKGRRFDLRYTFYGAHNHVVLLYHSMGRRDPRTKAYWRAAARQIGSELRYALTSMKDPERGLYRKLRGMANGVSRAGALLAGTLAGYASARRVEASRPHPPHKLAPI